MHPGVLQDSHVRVLCVGEVLASLAGWRSLERVSSDSCSVLCFQVRVQVAPASFTCALHQPHFIDSTCQAGRIVHVCERARSTTTVTCAD